MTEAVSPEEALAAARAKLAEQAGSVTGTPSAGIYGDQAGAQAPPVPLDVSAARPADVDTAALLERIAALEAAQQAAAPPPPEPMDARPQFYGAVSAEVQYALANVHARLVHIEDALGIDAAKVLADL
jgi:hypothetical protein